MMVICFHNPDEENGYLSNWYSSRFTISGVQFSSMEQYMMYMKAKCFHDNEAASEIVKTDDVAVIKAIGRRVREYNEVVWNGVRQIAVYEGLIAKFSQNPDIQEALLSTNDSILAECAVKDRIWGIGLSMNDPDRLDVAKWRGDNLLGFALTMVRDKLKGNR